MNTLKGNTLIAEKFPSEIYHLCWKPLKSKPHLPHYYRFHQSFDWLMVIVDAIEADGSRIEIKGTRVRYFAPDGKLLGSVEADTKIDALWLTVVGISLNK